MSLKYKIDVLKRLKENGYNSSRLRQEKILSESTIQKFRNGQMVSADNIDTLCQILNCQPGDIMEYVPDEV